MKPKTSLLLTATSKAVKLLERDWLELNKIQSSSSLNSKINFCNKAIYRTEDMLKDSLVSFLKDDIKIIFSSDNLVKDQIDNPLSSFYTNTKNDSKGLLLIEILDGKSNFLNSLPFFSIVITYLEFHNEKYETLLSIMLFPALHEIYYTEKGCGAWYEGNKYKTMRIRVASSEEFATNLEIDYSDFKIDKIPILRFFGCSSYETALFCSGKIKKITLLKPSPLLLPSFELIIREAGGIIKQDDNYFIAQHVT